MNADSRLYPTNLILFFVYGSIYSIIEYVYKNLVSGSQMSPAMFIIGGICGLAIGLLNEELPWDIGLIQQALCGMAIVTAIELVSGLVLNVWLQCDIWDYSHMPFNFMGQICLPFCIIWFFLSLVAIFLDDYLRYKYFFGEKPRYTLI